MGISKLQPIVMPTDWSKATQNVAYYVSRNGTGSETTFATLLNTSGIGYLRKLSSTIPTANATHLRVTVDGVVTVLIVGSMSGNDTMMGIFVNSDLTPLASTNSKLYAPMYTYGAQITNSGYSLYPDTSNINSNIILAQPIYYKNSLKIELSAANASTPINTEIIYCQL